MALITLHMSPSPPRFRRVNRRTFADVVVMTKHRMSSFTSNPSACSTESSSRASSCESFESSLVAATTSPDTAEKCESELDSQNGRDSMGDLPKEASHDDRGGESPSPGKGGRDRSSAAVERQVSADEGVSKDRLSSSCGQKGTPETAVEPTEASEPRGLDSSTSAVNDGRSSRQLADQCLSPVSSHMQRPLCGKVISGNPHRSPPVTCHPCKELISPVALNAASSTLSSSENTIHHPRDDNTTSRLSDDPHLMSCVRSAIPKSTEEKDDGSASLSSENGSSSRQDVHAAIAPIADATAFGTGSNVGSVAELRRSFWEAAAGPHAAPHDVVQNIESHISQTASKTGVQHHNDLQNGGSSKRILRSLSCGSAAEASEAAGGSSAVEGEAAASELPQSDDVDARGSGNEGRGPPCECCKLNEETYFIREQRKVLAALRRVSEEHPQWSSRSLGDTTQSNFRFHWQKIIESSCRNELTVYVDALGRASKSSLDGEECDSPSDDALLKEDESRQGSTECGSESQCLPKTTKEQSSDDVASQSPCLTNTDSDGQEEATKKSNSFDVLEILDRYRALHNSHRSLSTCGSSSMTSGRRRENSTTAQGVIDVTTLQSALTLLPTMVDYLKEALSTARRQQSPSAAARSPTSPHDSKHSANGSESTSTASSSSVDSFTAACLLEAANNLLFSGQLANLVDPLTSKTNDSFHGQSVIGVPMSIDAVNASSPIAQRQQRHFPSPRPLANFPSLLSKVNEATALLTSSTNASESVNFPSNSNPGDLQQTTAARHNDRTANSPPLSSDDHFPQAASPIPPVRSHCSKTEAQQHVFPPHHQPPTAAAPWIIAPSRRMHPFPSPPLTCPPASLPKHPPPSFHSPLASSPSISFRPPPTTKPITSSPLSKTFYTAELTPSLSAAGSGARHLDAHNENVANVAVKAEEPREVSLLASPLLDDDRHSSPASQPKTANAKIESPPLPATSAQLQPLLDIFSSENESKNKQSTSRRTAAAAQPTSSALHLVNDDLSFDRIAGLSSSGLDRYSKASTPFSDHSSSSMARNTSAVAAAALASPSSSGFDDAVQLLRLLAEKGLDLSDMMADSQLSLQQSDQSDSSASPMVVGGSGQNVAMQFPREEGAATNDAGPYPPQLRVPPLCPTSSLRQGGPRLDQSVATWGALSSKLMGQAAGGAVNCGGGDQWRQPSQQGGVPPSLLSSSPSSWSSSAALPAAIAAASSYYGSAATYESSRRKRKGPYWDNTSTPLKDSWLSPNVERNHHRIRTPANSDSSQDFSQYGSRSALESFSGVSMKDSFGGSAMGFGAAYNMSAQQRSSVLEPIPTPPAGGSGALSSSVTIGGGPTGGGHMMSSAASEHGVDGCCSMDLAAAAAFGVEGRGVRRPRSGVAGVHWATRPRGWVASWKEAGKRMVKYFPISHFGVEEALRLAIAYKQSKHGAA